MANWHILPDNSIFAPLGTAGGFTSGTFGLAGTYQTMSDAEYITFYAMGSGSAVGPAGTLNVFQGTDINGGGAKAVTGATLPIGTTGNGWAIVVKADQLDSGSNYTFINAVGTVPTGGSIVGGALFSIKTAKRVAPGTTGLAGSVYVVA